MNVDFLIDGMLSGTGIRDARNGGYVDASSIGLSDDFSRDLAAWQQRYEEAHFAGFPRDDVKVLDREGAILAHRAADELPEITFGYFSDGQMKLLS
jgi:hypothetical protein